MDMIIFEDVTTDSLPILADILNYYVEHTTVTFHTQPVTSDDMAGKVFFDQPRFKTFLIKQAEQIIGYCAVSPWKKQEAYEHTGEINVYLAYNYTGKGIGSIAIQHLLNYAHENDLNNLIAGICSENVPSIRLFEKAGFKHCAHFQKVGKKFGRILDTVYLQRLIEPSELTRNRNKYPR